MNSSPTLSYSYFAMFFECRAEANDIKLTENADPHIPEISRQKVITSAFLDWRSLPVREIHPQHREILSRWDQGANGSFFSIASDADDELVFYNSLTSAEMDISNNVPRYTVPGEDLINIREHIFDVAFSFPGEKREHIKPVVEEISKRLGKNKVFYDKYYQSQLSQPSLNTLLEHIYKRSKVVVAFLCAEYQSKEWCGMEMRGILEMIMERKEYKIMLIRMDDSKIDGIYKTDGYIDFWEYKTDAIANLIQERIKLQK
ncbi:MAG: TIR domain-containing protein [Saprospirales bacterium]|nr:TIR domain-containing protein [Saprospirales bacterium]